MILVTGGTGLVGSHLLYFLLKEEQQVRAIYRKGSNLDIVKKVFSYYTDTPDLFYNKIDWVFADINDIPALHTAFKGIEYVYHCAALISFDEKDYRRLKKINIEGTANVVNLSIHYNIKKLCHLSSIAALGKEINNGIITEKTDWNPDEKNDVYAISKYGGEMEVWRGTQEGLNAVVLQPGVIIGEGHWNSLSGDFIKIIQKGISYYPGGSTGIVDVKDVCKAMVLAMKSKNNHESYILVGHNISYKKLLQSLATALEVKIPSKNAEKWMLKLLSSIDGLIAIFRGKRLLTQKTVHTLYNNTRYNGSKIKTELLLEYTSFEDTVERVISKYKS